MSIPPFWGSPRKQEVRSNSALFWAPLLILSLALKGGDPRGGRGYVATLPTSGPLVILPSTLKGGDPLGGRCYVATLPTSGPLLILPPRSEAEGIPEAAGVT